MRIVKVIYDNGEEMEVKEITPLDIKPEDDAKEKYLKRRRYDKQFKRFELDILNDLDSDTIEEYAECNFDLVNEDDIEKKELDAYSDEELAEEIKGRSSKGKSIISEQFLDRFTKIIEKENYVLLDNILTDFEAKLNI